MSMIILVSLFHPILIKTSLIPSKTENYIQDTLAFGKVCRKIPYRDSLEYFTADTKPNDLMVDNKQFQDLDKRRIQKWFENCLAPPDSKPAPQLDCEVGNR